MSNKKGFSPAAGAIRHIRQPTVPRGVGRSRCLRTAPLRTTGRRTPGRRPPSWSPTVPAPPIGSACRRSESSRPTLRLGVGIPDGTCHGCVQKDFITGRHRTTVGGWNTRIPSGTMAKNMEKVTVGNTHEWRWTQTHACGHETPQSCLGGARPDAERDRLSRTECPKCRLDGLLKHGRQT